MNAVSLVRKLGVAAGLASASSALVLGAVPRFLSPEEVAPHCDAIVVGRVIDSDEDALQAGAVFFTRHTLEVELWISGNGPETISLLTEGGYHTAEMAGKERRLWLQTTGAVGISVGERFLAFLINVNKASVRSAKAQRQHAPFFKFHNWNGAKYGIQTDPDTLQEFVVLRLRNKRYMRTEAALRIVGRLEASPEHAQLRATGVLPPTKSVSERVQLEDLPERLREIIKGETRARP